MPTRLHDKAELRADMIGRRRALSEARIRRASLAAVRHVQQIDGFIKARTVGAYVAVNGELDPAGILSVAETDNKKPYLPVLDERHALRFAPAGRHMAMQCNRYGIPEPVCDPQSLVTIDQLDVIIVPLVAFDDRGHRLGMGAGYYDRALSTTEPGKPLRIGFAYEFQRIDTIEPEPWDIPMDLIATDGGVRAVEQCPPAND